MMRKRIDINEQQPIEEQEYLCVCEDGCYWLGMWQPYDKEFAMIGASTAKALLLSNGGKNYQNNHQVKL